MNYEYADAYLEIKFPTGNIRRIKKKIIKEISQINDNGGCHVMIWVEGDTYKYDGSFEDFEKNSKTVFI